MEEQLPLFSDNKLPKHFLVVEPFECGEMTAAVSRRLDGRGLEYDGDDDGGEGGQEEIPFVHVGDVNNK